MSKLTVYVDLISQPSRAVVIFLKECDIPFEQKVLNIGRGQHKSPELLALNPMGKLPTIEHNGFGVFESHTILRYLCQAFPERVPDSWYPRTDLKQRTIVDMYLDWHHTNLRFGAANLFRELTVKPLAFGEKFKADPAALKQHATTLHNSLSMMESQFLKGKRFIGGDKPCIGDLLAACELSQLHTLSPEAQSALFSPYPKVQAWRQSVQSSLSHYEPTHSILMRMAAKAAEARTSLGAMNPDIALFQKPAQKSAL